MHFSPYHYSPAEYTTHDPSSRDVAQWLIGALRSHFSASSDRNLNAIVPVIEHIGSTALGVAGKGIVDIALYLSPSLTRLSNGPFLSHASNGASLSNSSTYHSFNKTLEHLSHTDKVALITRELAKSHFVKSVLAELDAHLWRRSKVREES